MIVRTKLSTALSWSVALEPETAGAFGLRTLFRVAFDTVLVCDWLEEEDEDDDDDWEFDFLLIDVSARGRDSGSIKPPC